MSKIKIDDGISMIIPTKKVKLDELFDLMESYEDGLEFEIVNISEPSKSHYNKAGENKQYFFMDIEYDIDGSKKTGIPFNLGEPIGVNEFKIHAQNKVYEFIKLFYNLDEAYEVSVDFDMLKNKFNGLKFRGKVISYYDNKRQLQHMLVPVEVLD